jgi:hypothetical protein
VELVRIHNYEVVSIISGTRAAIFSLTTDPGVPGSIPGHYKKKVVGLEWGPLGLVSTTEELLDRKVAAPV